MKITCHEFVESKDGGYFIEYECEEEFPETEGRHKPLCVVCGFPTYPECRKWCQHEGDKMKRIIVDEDKIKGKLVLSEEEFQDAIIKME